MAIKILIIVDGIFNLTTQYPAADTNSELGSDVWFTISHVIATLRNAGFSVDTASRGFNATGDFMDAPLINSVPDPAATLKGPDPAHPVTFRFDDPSVNLSSYSELWLFGFEGVNYGDINQGPVVVAGTEPGALADTELAAITAFMQAGGGIFAAGDHDGLGAAMSGRIPRVRYMRKWYANGDTPTGIPPHAERNSPGGSVKRIDTLQPGAGDTTDGNGNLTFPFDNQSDDIPQPLFVLNPSHPAIQGASGPLAIFPDHMHEGEVIAPSGPQLMATSATDATLSFAGVNFTEFPAISGFQAPPEILAKVQTGTAGAGTALVGHFTVVNEGGPLPNCENNNFHNDSTLCQVLPFDKANASTTGVGALAAYDGATMNVGRIVTDSSFHHYLDLNLLGDPCSVDPVKTTGFLGSTTGRAYLAELDAFYVNLANWLAWTRQLYFVLGKNYYGRDEVNDSLDYPSAFYLILEGYTPNLVAGATPVLSGTFKAPNIPGLTIGGPIVTYEFGNSGSSGNVTQRIRFEYAVHFTSASLAAFPSPGNAPAALTLDASITIQATPLALAAVEMFLLGGEDPYFANVNAAAGNPFYLSQDLRVFTITPTANGQTPIGNVPFNFVTGNATTLDAAAGYHYIQALLDHLNTTIGFKNTNYDPPDTNATDPLNSLLPQQQGASKGDSSVTPFTGSAVNYNFAIARVRLRGAAGAVASNVKVFFRAFTTQTFDTDYINTAAAISGADSQVTYPSTGTDVNNPQTPLPGTFNGSINGCSLPFFATANFADGTTGAEYNTGGVNNLAVSIPAHHDYTWAYFGCFLNVNDPSNQYGGQPVQHWFAGSAHNCLVAQIAYGDAPIENANGVIANPEISDKLAQRNLQVSTSGNPGFPATHRVPLTLDLRPSPPAQSSDRSSILSYPDEIMIDWGRTPLGSVARLYWPTVRAADVVSLATRLYRSHALVVEDPHTLRWEIASPVTYVPIPVGQSDACAGLLTVDLPASVRVGNQYDITARRVTVRRKVAKTVVQNRASNPASKITIAGGRAEGSPLTWRYVSGSFHLTINVAEEQTIIRSDDNLLAILKWRLSLVGPGNRWYPVLLRYISVLTGRIDGMGGNATNVPPSPSGYPPPTRTPGKHPEQTYTGKVIDLRYDRFGDFVGFTIVSERGHKHHFRGCERKVEELLRRAFIERILISVFVELHDPEWPAFIVLQST